MKEQLLMGELGLVGVVELGDPVGAGRVTSLGPGYLVVVWTVGEAAQEVEGRSHSLVEIPHDCYYY